MKRPFFILFILCCQALFSQNEQNPVFILKPSLGFNGCQIHGDSYDGYDKPGLFGGIAVNGRINKKASLELGFYFSQKGSKHNSNPDKGDYTYLDIHLNYIDLPLSFRYVFYSKFFFTVGPSLAYLISDHVDDTYGDQTDNFHFNKFEVGVNAGLGWQFGKKWSAEIRTSNSVTPILSWGQSGNHIFYPNPVARFFNKGLYNNILTFLLTYNIDLKKRGQS